VRLLQAHPRQRGTHELTQALQRLGLGVARGRSHPGHQLVAVADQRRLLAQQLGLTQGQPGQVDADITGPDALTLWPAVVLQMLGGGPAQLVQRDAELGSDGLRGLVAPQEAAHDDAFLPVDFRP
jgi:hypothetical protein